MIRFIFVVRSVPALLVPPAFGFPFFEMRVTRDGLVRSEFGFVREREPLKASRQID
jgi:hypothetical protein